MVSALPIIAKAEIMQRQTRSHSLSPVLVLLAFSVFINYVDRGNLSIAAPMLKDELGSVCFATWNPALIFFLDLWILSDSLGLARRSAKRQLGHGNRLSPLVRSHQRHRICARIYSAVGGAPYPWHGRVGCLSVVFKDIDKIFP